MKDSEVVVVGGGVIGLSIAWRLGTEGAHVTLVDPAPGRGASYVGAGMLAPVTEAHYGEEAQLDLNIRSAASWPQFASALERAAAMRVGLREDGTLLVAYDRGDRAEIEDLAAFHQSLDLGSRLIGPSAARELEPLLAPGVQGALFAAGDRQIDNRRVLSALALAARSVGVALRSERALALLASGGVVTGVRTDSGLLLAPCVVLAGGHESGTLDGIDPSPLATLRPVRGQILRLRTREPRLELSRTVRARVIGSHVYLVPRTGGGLVIGATSEECGADRSITAGAVYQLLRDAIRVAPVAAEYELLECAAGLRPATDDQMPVLGPGGPDGLLLATGHYRNGILLAPATAEAIVACWREGALPAWAVPFAAGRARLLVGS